MRDPDVDRIVDTTERGLMKHGRLHRSALRSRIRSLIAKRVDAATAEVGALRMAVERIAQAAFDLGEQSGKGAMILMTKQELIERELANTSAARHEQAEGE